MIEHWPTAFCDALQPVDKRCKLSGGSVISLCAPTSFVELDEQPRTARTMCDQAHPGGAQAANRRTSDICGPRTTSACGRVPPLHASVSASTVRDLSRTSVVVDDRFRVIALSETRQRGGLPCQLMVKALAQLMVKPLVCVALKALARKETSRMLWFAAGSVAGAAQAVASLTVLAGLSRRGLWRSDDSVAWTTR